MLKNSMCFCSHLKYCFVVGPILIHLSFKKRNVLFLKILSLIDATMTVIKFAMPAAFESSS